MRRTVIGLLVMAALFALPAVAGARVLLVGSYHGIKGQYSSIQAAVNAAQPGDWILVGPGDYKEHSGLAPTGRSDLTSGVLITKRDIYLRGMNRNTVIVDGTKPGSAPCSNRKADQEFGPHGKGLNGIMVYKANDVWVQNLTACNYLHGSGDTGNEIWWNGGDGSWKIGGWGYLGSYLNATSTFYDKNNSDSAAQYGIFSSNWDGGTWDQTYASNFNDSGYYIGACQQKCFQKVNHAWAQFNALGYSGSNSGGWLLVENSVFSWNQDGFDTNSQNGDNPPPQNGSCPKGVKPPVKGAPTCWVFYHNLSYANDNPNVPTAGLAGGGPVGTGISISGGRFDTLMDNRFVDNYAWGVIFVPFPDSGPPCRGGTNAGGQVCIYDEWGDALIGNTFKNNGRYHNRTNGDFALTNTEPGPTDCFAHNKDTAGPLTATPPNAQTIYPVCNGQTVPPSDTDPRTAPYSDQFTEEVACDSTLYLPLAGKAPCSPSDHYPRRHTVNMHPLPPAYMLPSMPNPCAGVPSDPWCPGSNGSSGGW